jgi:hypothetical protein
MSHVSATQLYSQTLESTDELKFARHPQPMVALGMAVNFLSTKVPFSLHPTGVVVPSVGGQVNRGHYLFGLRSDRIVGFLGWGLGDEALGRSFSEATSDLSAVDLSHGRCVIIMYIASNDRGFTKSAIGKLAQLYPNHVYYGRRYKCGRYLPKMGLLVP